MGEAKLLEAFPKEVVDRGMLYKSTISMLLSQYPASLEAVSSYYYSQKFGIDTSNQEGNLKREAIKL